MCPKSGFAATGELQQIPVVSGTAICVSKMKLRESISNAKVINMLRRFREDEQGVIISAELVLVGTILIMGMIVGLVELQTSMVAELSDLGNAIGNVDQSYRTPGITSHKTSGAVMAQTTGATFNDRPDIGDCNSVITCEHTTSRGEKQELSKRTEDSTAPRNHPVPSSQLRRRDGPPLRPENRK